TYLLSQKRYTIGQINGQGFLMTLAVSAVAVPSYLVFLRFYGGASDPALASVLRLATVLIPILLLKYLSVALLLGMHRIRWFNLANLMQAGLLLALMCVNLFVFHGGRRGALVAYVISELCVTGVAMLVARRELAGSRMFERPPPGMFRRSVVYGLQGHIGSVFVTFMYRFDMFLILSMVGLHTQGLYSIAVLLAEKLSHIPHSVQVVLFPRLSSLDQEEANQLTPRVTRNAFLVTLLAGAALYLLSRSLILLFYGEKFLPALGALRVLIPGVAMLSIAVVLSGYFSGRDRRIYQTIATAAAFGVNAGLCFLWIPDHGIEGAAWASTTAYTLQSALMLAFFTRLSGRGVLETVIIRREDLALYGGLVRRLLRRGGR
ncbi:polysaccharide biosynthesis C-terminal domain-containing protein, partial [bacterium]|nr:polysaccharide biosynthesis C-terminal domain-containing protein [bacterium]